MTTTSRPYRIAAATVAALVLAGCGGQAVTTSSRPVASPAAAAAPSPSTVAIPAAGPDTTACQHFSEIAAPLTTALANAATDPASIGAVPGEARMLRHDGKLMDSWSNTATDSFSGSQMVPLQLDLLNAAIGLSVLGAGYGDPGAASDAQTAVSGVSRVKADCGEVLG